MTDNNIPSSKDWSEARTTAVKKAVESFVERCIKAIHGADYLPIHVADPPSQPVFGIVERMLNAKGWAIVIRVAGRNDPDYAVMTILSDNGEK